MAGVTRRATRHQAATAAVNREFARMKILLGNG
jgi:hypothetical protein